MISVIIPAYNAEKTIERAIMSAIRQIPDGEILVVENGCTDDTERIIDRIKQQFSQVYLLHSAKGVSAARNEGIEHSNGDWIMFLDADDYFENDTQAILNQYIVSNDADLVLFGHKAGNEHRLVTNGKNNSCYSSDTVSKARVLMLENPTRYMQVWAKLFRTSIIKANNIRFNEKLALSEDSDFTMKYSKHCHSIRFESGIIYHYSLESSSTMRKKDGTKIQKYILAMEETSLEVQEESEEIKQAFYKYVLMHMNIAMVREVFAVGNAFPSKKEQINTLKTVSQNAIFSEAIVNTKIKDCFSLRMLPVLCLKQHLYKGAAFIYIIRAKQNARNEAQA